MIVPSIDLKDGQTVQLVGGEKLAIEAGDPVPLAERFGRVGEIAVIDLDAALGSGENSELVRSVVGRAACRVGGGIRSAAKAREWLDAGAAKVILGTAARPEVLRELPRDRVIAALDAVNGEVVVEGWKTRTGASITDRMAELAPYVGGFLVTFVEREGRLGGTDLKRAEELARAAGGRSLTVAGGVTTASELAALDALGINAQVGMALYTGKLGLADAFSAPLTSDRPDGLWPTVVVDERGVALGLCWSNAESLDAALESGTGVYWSRKRGLWRKGATSGAVQELIAVDLDCDRDALRFTVRQSGSGFCHLGSRSCWGAERGLGRLEKTIRQRIESAPAGSYTRRLIDEPDLLSAKITEEAQELTQAAGRSEVTWEAADVLYFAMVRAIGAGVELADIEAELDRRSGVVTRRPGNAKEVTL